MSENLGIRGFERIDSDEECQLQDWVDGFMKPFASLERRPDRTNVNSSRQNTNVFVGFSSPTQGY